MADSFFINGLPTNRSFNVFIITLRYVCRWPRWTCIIWHKDLIHPITTVSQSMISHLVPTPPILQLVEALMDNWMWERTRPRAWVCVRVCVRADVGMCVCVCWYCSVLGKILRCAIYDTRLSPSYEMSLILREAPTNQNGCKMKFPLGEFSYFIRKSIFM